MGHTRLDLYLSGLEPGVYRGEFLDLADATETWRFRVGTHLIQVVPGAAPTDLERTGGTIESSGYEGGSVQGFEIGLRNTTATPMEVIGASTEIPGLPVTWVLVERDPIRIVDTVAIPAGERVPVNVGTQDTAKPVSFVLATPEIAYRVDDADEVRALYDPILDGGFGQPSDVTAYRDSLPADACAQEP